jgi:hypothetical protein
MASSVYMQTCLPEHIDGEGVCMQPVWVEKPEPVLPPLTLEQGTVVAFSIVGCWTLGLIARLYFRVGQQGRY